MEQIKAGQIRAYYLFDVADAIELPQLSQALKVGTGQARLLPKPPSPSYVQFQPLPVTVSGEDLQVSGPADFKVGLKFYDYGVISITLWKPFSCTWPQLLALGSELVGNSELESFAEKLCREIVERCGAACIKPRQDFLDEDYMVFALHEFDRPVTAVELFEAHGGDIAELLRGEPKPLHPDEVREVLTARLSYLNDDLVVVTWNTAFVYDTPQGAEGACELMEFANSQLLEFRYYDALLDRRLDRVYAEIQERRSMRAWRGKRYGKTAREIQSLIIDIESLTDKTENTLKVVGDIYAARLFALVESRLGLDRWKDSVKEKLDTLNQIYRFLTDQVNASRSLALETIIVVLFALDLVLILVGLVRP